MLVIESHIITRFTRAIDLTTRDMKLVFQCNCREGTKSSDSSKKPFHSTTNVKTYTMEWTARPQNRKKGK
jgi:hypothetical protein